MTSSSDSPVNATQLAEQVEKNRYVVVGYLLALPPLFDPSMPLMDVYKSYGQSTTSPLNITRRDGSHYSEDSLGTWLQRIATSGGGSGVGLGPEVLTMSMLYIMIRIGDHMTSLDLYAPRHPLTEFVRHLRNACAHGNRWYFCGQEPRMPARCREINLDASLHDGRAIWGSDGLLSPAEYLDVLDDLATYLRSLP